MDIQEVIEQLARRGYHLDPEEAESVRAAEGYTVPYPFRLEYPKGARSIHIYCYSQDEVETLLASLKNKQATSVTEVSSGT